MSVSLYQALEASFNVLATAGYSLMQPNPGGIVDFYVNATYKARNPITKNRQDYAGDIVDASADPKITCDLNKDLLDRFGSMAFLAVERFAGGTGIGRFSPTAITANAIAVAAGGALKAGSLVVLRGMTNPANNGVFHVDAGSVDASIAIVETLVAETPPGNATVEFAGFQGTSGDIHCTATDGNGHFTITSTTIDFTGLGILPPMWLDVGGGTAATPGAFGFATAGCRGAVRVLSVAAHTIVCDRSAAAFSIDAGTGKTIQLWFHSFLRNVPINSGDALDPMIGNASADLVLEIPGIGAAGVTTYLPLTGAVLDSLELNAAAKDLIKATLSFKACAQSPAGVMTAPTPTQPTGVSTAIAPVAQLPLNVVTQLPRLRIVDTTSGNYNAVACADIDTWKLMITNNVDAQDQQGWLGPKRMIPGNFQASCALTGFLTQPDLLIGANVNTTFAAEGCLRNQDCGVLWDMPALKAMSPNPSFPENGAITIATTLKANVDAVFNYSLGLSKFAFLPPN